MLDRVRRKNTRRCARAPARFYPAPVFPLRARAAFHNGKSKTDSRKNDPDNKNDASGKEVENFVRRRQSFGTIKSVSVRRWKRRFTFALIHLQ